MRLVVQRVRQASVRVAQGPPADQAEEAAGSTKRSVGEGLLVLVGFGREDGENLHNRPAWDKMLHKLTGLRVFPDADGVMNVSVRDHRDANGVAGAVLAVSQFTLYADCAKGLRPSYTGAAPPDTARALYDRFLADLEERLPGRTACGVFGAAMEVALVNWGPVTITLDTDGLR